jgi:hypothetical protein
MRTAISERSTFDVASRAACRLLEGEPDLTVFSTWALAFVRGQESHGRRHAALDGLLSALEDHEAGRRDTIRSRQPPRSRHDLAATRSLPSSGGS